MKKELCAMVACAILVLPMVASAQEEESPKPYVYASYFECAAGSEWMVDGIVEDLYKPVFDAGVEDGTIAGWGWMGHHTGGKWRRLLYRTAPTLEGALEAVGALGKKVFEANPQASAQFGEVCSSHVDYIWQRTAGSGEPSDVGQDNAKAGTSVYLQCDMAREDRADEIVETVFAPIYDRHVAEGNIAGWGWLEHVVGGKYRRIATMGGESHAKILETRGEIIKELWEKHEAEVKEYSSICGSHSDYLWNLLQ